VLFGSGVGDNEEVDAEAGAMFLLDNATPLASSPVMARSTDPVRCRTM